jgi:hypothetical protein
MFFIRESVFGANLRRGNGCGIFHSGRLAWLRLAFLKTHRKKLFRHSAIALHQFVQSIIVRKIYKTELIVAHQNE